MKSGDNSGEVVNKIVQLEIRKNFMHEAFDREMIFRSTGGSPNMAIKRSVDKRRKHMTH
jgi:hypothetical protein